VANVAPSIGAFAGATLLPGEIYQATGSFTDPGADAWNATVGYGDGSGVSGLALTGQSFSLAHLYAAAGTFTVTVRVADDDAMGVATQTVTVLTPAQGVEQVIELVAQLAAAGRLSAGNASALQSLLRGALQNINIGDLASAMNQLEAVLRQITAFEGSGKLSAADAAMLRAAVLRVLQSVSAVRQPQ
jgi:hypothetical protein